MANVYVQCPTDAPSPRARDWYRVRYIFLWLLPITAGIAFLVLLPWGIYAAVPHDSDLHPHGNHGEQASAMIIIALVCFFFVLWMSGSAQQLRFRSGMGFFGGIGGESTDAAPITVAAIKAAVQQFRVMGVVPTVVGGAWSNVLRMESAAGPRLHMRRMKGPVPGLDLTWYAGTECMEVNNALRKLKSPMQLINVPSYGGVTLGAWVATQGHGMTGRAFAHGPITVKAKVLDMRTGIETDDGPEKLLDKFGKGSERAAQYVILFVTVAESPTLVPDAKVLRQGRWITTVEDAKWVNRKEAQVAVMFVGGSNTLALTWQPYIGDDISGGGWLMDIGILMFAVLGWGLGDPRGQGRDRTERLSKVPAFFHFYLSPVYIWFFMLLRAMNPEFYTSDLDLTPELTLKLTTELQDIYSRYTGRCELRFTGKLTYFDLFALSPGAYREVLRVLATNGVKKVAQHPGKYQLRAEEFACAGLDLVTVYDVAR